MSKKVQQKSSFPAMDEQGRVRQIDVWVEVSDVAHPGGSNAEIEGMATLRTTNGENINYLEKGKYQIARTGEILTSRHPLAL